MEVGIIGLPRSGKTTVFNALTNGVVAVGSRGGLHVKPRLGLAKVPDPRVSTLSNIFNPRRVVLSEVTYVDNLAPTEGSGKTVGISGELLNFLQRTNLLLIVTRAFEDPSVAPESDISDPVRDVETMLYELTFADMEILDRRLDRIEEGLKGAKASQRTEAMKEQAFLARLRQGLEVGYPVRDQRVEAESVQLLEGFQLLTAKPILIVVNIGENEECDSMVVESDLASIVTGPRVAVTTLSGKLEMELTQMDEQDEREFRESLKLGEPGLSRVIRVSHEILDLVTFFTGNANEVRAWTVARGTSVVKAAGKIHSDLERGFIRAEVVRFSDLEKCKNLSEARRRGVIRQEGRSYPVQEGDVINVLFNV